MDYRDFNINIPNNRRHGNIKTYCPRCRSDRKNKRDKSLSVNLDEGVWNCHHCGWKGSLHNNRDLNGYQPVQNYVKPQQVELTDLPRDMVRWFADVRHISEPTLKALKISSEAYMRDGKEKHWVTFNYYLNGERINYKQRTADKQFRMFNGGKVLPYNIDSIKGKKECIITEGEMDVLALYEAGYHSAISAPTGSNRNLSWLDEYIEEYFDDKETIYIAGDTDEAGRKLRDELLIRFGSDRCKLVTWGDDCKDANDVLIKHGRDTLRHCIEQAADIPQEGVFSEADYHNELTDIWHQGLRRGKTLGFPKLDECISFETKRLMVVTGIPGSGKSEFIDQISVMLNLRYGMKVGYFSPENMPLTFHAAKIIEKLTGTKMRESELPWSKFEAATNYLRNNFFHIMPESAVLDDILDGARWLVRKRGIKILVIDPYNRIESEKDSGEPETTYISRVLDMLSDFAVRNDVLVILMAHPRKIGKDNGDNGVPTLYDINGSANFYNKADYGVIVHRNKEAHHTLVRVAKVRFRHLGQGGEVFFKFNMLNGRFYEEDSEEDNRNYLEVNIDEPMPKKSPQKPHSWLTDEDEKESLDWLVLSPNEETLPF